ncbi:PTS lactose/cellobiose transporter subunit IIA [Clostridium neonatale]|uniref:PTS lactose/cellobiose transporter subunit IIA n=1 Tax=Clostridium neonatale TaxID=137838 RepID=UPI00291B5835|nr:PTS lactose/cellobiose transporter subunit IIA [Clostridium neonatale]CAI3243148.1 cellobiose PTS system EIIA component [Clostridium neonatale]
MNNLELSSFKIISSVGMAKSSYIEAMNAAEKGNFDLADEKIKEGEKFFSEGHEAHSALIQQESSGDDIILDVLFCLL